MKVTERKLAATEELRKRAPERTVHVPLLWENQNTGRRHPTPKGRRDTAHAHKRERTECWKMTLRRRGQLVYPAPLLLSHPGPA